MQSVAGRVPTLPDVERLRESIGVPSEGDVIEYARLEDVTGLNRASSRFKTVITAWRKMLYRTFNVILRAVPTVGFRCESGSGRINLAASGFSSGVRRMVGAADIAMRTDSTRLSGDEKRAADYMINAAGSIKLAYMMDSKRLNLPSPE